MHITISKVKDIVSCYFAHIDTICIFIFGLVIISDNGVDSLCSLDLYFCNLKLFFIDRYDKSEENCRPMNMCHDNAATVTSSPMNHPMCLSQSFCAHPVLSEISAAESAGYVDTCIIHICSYQDTNKCGQKKRES